MVIEGPKGKPSPEQKKPVHRRLYKSHENRIIGGVCGGLGEYFNIDPTLIRIGWVILALLWGSGIVAYVVAMIVMPSGKEEEIETRSSQSGREGQQMWWGVLLIAVGLVLLINAYIPRPCSLWFWWLPLSRFLWPLLLVVIGLWILGTQLRKSAAERSQSTAPQVVGRTLRRVSSERMVAGICGGLAEFLQVDPSMVRIIWVLTTLASVGLGVLVYLAMWILVPEESGEREAS